MLGTISHVFFSLHHPLYPLYFVDSGVSRIWHWGGGSEVESVSYTHLDVYKRQDL